MPTLLVVLGTSFLPVPIHAGLFRAQVSLHDALHNISNALNSSIVNLTNATKAASEGLPGPYDPHEQRYLNSLRLIPHEFQRAVYLFNTMDKDRNGVLSAVEFSQGLSVEAPAAASAGKYLYPPLAEGGSILKPHQFYRFFALAVTTPPEFAWQDGERAQLSSYLQDDKAKLLRLFISYDADSNDAVSEAELQCGFNNTLLQGVRAAKIPVSNLFETRREMKFAEEDFRDFTRGSDSATTGLGLVEFVKLGKEAKRKAYAPMSGSQSYQVFGCFTMFFLVCMNA